MDVKLGNLIEKIKKEGIEEAQQSADALLEDAKKKADSIVENAKKEAEKIVADAKAQSQQFQENSELAVKQAARDSELLLKSRITGMFDQVFKREVAQSLSPEFMKELIVKLVEEWAKGSELDVVVGEKEKAALEAVLFQGVKANLKDTVNIRVSTDVTSGFQIGLKGEDVYYDFTDASIADTLKLFLKPKIKEILDSSNG